jgi:hypothetical protein
MLSGRFQSPGHPLGAGAHEAPWLATMTEAQRKLAGAEARTPRRPGEVTLEYGAGLDLGQQADYSVLSQIVWDADQEEPAYTVWSLTRWPLQTRYSQVADDVRELLAGVPGKRRPALAADATGVGRPIMELLQQTENAFDLCPILITGGNAITRDAEGIWHVPKRELIYGLVKLFTSARLKINPELPLAPVLAQELRDFTLKITRAGNETFQGMTERTKDDMVLSAALACWLAEHRPQGVLDAFM